MSPQTTDADRGARALRTTIRALVRRFALSERADVSCCGMTVAQAATLEALAAEGPLRMGALGRRLGIRASTLSRNVARLEERGLIAREVDPADARASRVRLTPSGRRAAAAVEAREVRFFDRILERLEPSDRQVALTSVGALVQAVREASEECCPGAFTHLMESASDEENEHGSRRQAGC